MIGAIPYSYAIVGGIFVMACAWFNYRSGLRKGHEEGIEFLLSTLADNHVIEIQLRDNTAKIVRGSQEGAYLHFDNFIQ
jgi:hypothetical protein